MPTSCITTEFIMHMLKRKEISEDGDASSSPPETVTKTVTSTGGARISARTSPEEGEGLKGVERPNGLRMEVEEENGVEVNGLRSTNVFLGAKSGEVEGDVGNFKAEEGSETRKIEALGMCGESDLVVEENVEGVGLDGVDFLMVKCSETKADEGTVEAEVELGAQKMDCEIMGKESNIWSKKEEKKVLASNKSKGLIGRWKLSFEEWLQLPENSPNVTQETVDKMEAKHLVKAEDQSDMAIEGKRVTEDKVVLKVIEEKVDEMQDECILKAVEQSTMAIEAKGVAEDKAIVKVVQGKVDEMEVKRAVEMKEQSDMVVEAKGVLTDDKAVVKVEPDEGVGNGKAKVPFRWNMSFEEWIQLPENSPNFKQEKVDEKEVDRTIEVKAIVKVEPRLGVKNEANVKMEIDRVMKVKEEPDKDIERRGAVQPNIIVKKEVEEIVCAQPISVVRPISQMDIKPKPSYLKNGKIEENALSTVRIEDGDFPEEPDWLLVGRSFITGLSTTKGRKIESNEIVHFAFPNNEKKSMYTSSRAANAAFSIVRFSTKRNGEIGRLTTEWANCLIPLVSSGKVKVLARCIVAPINLRTFQEIMLYVSFYIHHSIFTEGETSWKLEPVQIDSTTYPLLQLFQLLKIKPFQKAEFTPEELDSRKRSLNLGGVTDEVAAALPMVKRRKGCLQGPEQNKDEQAISEASLNKIVGAADVYDLKEMDPPDTLTCDLRPYQKQALYWMSESEKGVDVEEAKKMLHPCWAAYRICDKRAPAIYLNNFSGEATTRFPSATQMARGGILADAMGLGKTVMTIALILARRGRGNPNDQEKQKASSLTDTRKPKGGTLIICPMALLCQWKEELETHSELDSISIFVHYGVDRSDNPKVIAEPDIVLTTYGVLTAAYKSEGENSIFHQVDWYRVVLDEAHTIKSSKTQGARAAYSLSSYCRWCLTGTPLQNSLEDLYSLLCFLHVEPWCNWAWWHKLIQRPYENGDRRGLNLIKAILRPLMLRRTKETKDKAGRPILVLPPTDIQIIECEQSEAEHDFYDALFRRSKVQFDQFVAQGKVLHNFANILELLLRLRQCCNHPFLVMSRGDTQEYADLNKLAKKFLETNPEKGSQNVPTRAYIEEVVEGLKRGENAECPICLESADDPVLTPCVHRMCRECLFSSWRSPTMGFCPICRQLLKKNEIITCPSENRFRIDVEKNWKESSKVMKLLECLERLKKSGSREKSIVFSQWTSFLDLLEIPLKRKKIGFLRFDGKLQQKQREKVLKEFNETREKTVLLMSLKAGGVGLNLTAASNVFLMDPWWNPAVEEQAIMRIHRIGQKRTVHVRRFIVKDTVEERMQQVQARKQHMIAGALTDEDVRSARIEELKMLFR